MDAISIPPDIAPQLAEAGLDLRSYGELWMYAEENALARAEEDRAPFAAEMALEARLASERGRQMAALETVRAVAGNYPESFNAAVADALSDESIDPEAKSEFDQGVGVTGGDYASVAVAICDRVQHLLRHDSGTLDSIDNGLPPVSGAESLACDLVAVAGMACGAACVIGCGPCCIGAGAAALGYVAFCT